MVIVHRRDAENAEKMNISRIKIFKTLYYNGYQLIKRQNYRCGYRGAKALGPGLLEFVYEEYKCHELNLQGFSLERQRNNLPQADGPFYFPASLPC